MPVSRTLQHIHTELAPPVVAASRVLRGVVAWRGTCVALPAEVWLAGVRVRG